MRYRKRGTEVDAMQWTGVLAPSWLSGLILTGRARIGVGGSDRTLYLDPPSGKGAPLVAQVGDWIVRNGRGAVFPLSPDKFAGTYEPINIA